ncbi:hypothetical protein [Leptolyngbya sp. CCY15150]|nr:hypothetical protein [Leptolyngbya sp. CCY15150]
MVPALLRLFFCDDRDLGAGAPLGYSHAQRRNDIEMLWMGWAAIAP